MREIGSSFMSDARLTVSTQSGFAAKQLKATYERHDQSHLNDFTRDERQRAILQGEWPAEAHSEREPGAAAPKDNRFAAKQSARKRSPRRLRLDSARTFCIGDTLNQPARRKCCKRIGDQIACRGTDEARGAGNAEWLKDR